MLYDEPKNSMDIIYIGGSNAHHHFNSLLAYELYGFTTGFLATGSQPFISIKYLIMESQKYQKPDLYIIDLTRIQDSMKTSFAEQSIREVTDILKLNKNKLDLINEILNYSNIDKNEYINYYFNFLIYHNSWKNISYNNFHPPIYKGYYFWDNATDIVPQENYYWDETIVKLPDKNKKILLDLINYIKSNELNVLFVIPKRTFWYPGQEMLNDAISIICKSGFKVINFNKIEDLNIDFATDFYDSGHLNVYGATKYTLYFSQYLKKNYHLNDHRDDKLYVSWEEQYQIFKRDFNARTFKEFDSLLK